MCCTGCESVARTIVAAGLERYYQHREVPAVVAAPGEGADLAPGIDPAPGPAHPSPGEAGWPAPARRGIAAAAEETGGSTREHGDGTASDEDFERLAARRGYLQQAPQAGHLQACLMIDGIRCGACVWLLEQGLGQAPGVARVEVNYAQQQALVQWDAGRTSLAGILAALRGLGYHALPFDPSAREERLQRIERQEVRRLFVAGLVMMQVMMLQTPLYWAHPDDVDPSEVGLLRWASLVLTLPALLYSGWPLLRGAVRDLVHRHLGMDVPVALGLLAAYLASAVNTWRGAGEVYFDTVTMFVFLLLAARWLEARARRQSLRWLDRLSAALPQGVRRIAAQAPATLVLAEDLQVGDTIVLDPGASVPADALSLEDTLLADCSLLSGESEPQCFVRGAVVPSGAVLAQAHTARLQVVRPAQASTRADLQRLIARAGSTRPALAELADRAARHFIAGLLVFVVIVVGIWLVVDPERALDRAITVLVVSCPCALSLAVPSAIAAVQSSLAQVGVVLQRGDALERLASITDVVFDKTGTLSQGRPEVRQAELFDPALEDETVALLLALPLAQASPHPLSLALARRAEHALAGLGPADRHAVQLANVRGALGEGVEARVAALPGVHQHAVQGAQDTQDTQDTTGSLHRLALEAGAVLRLGSYRFACARQDQSSPSATYPSAPNPAAPNPAAPNPPATESRYRLQEVWLSVNSTPLARWLLDDPLRADAQSSLRTLHRMGLRLHLLSGDHQASVERVLEAIGPGIFATACGAQTPEDKWQAVAGLQAQGRRVLMVGDGLNDAAVLAAADMSAAVGQASDLARLHAGAIVLSGRLQSVVLLLAAGRQAMRLMRQNVGWATVYNLCAIPAAALGWIPAWGAALGMSASSVLVVLNSLRGLRWKRSSYLFP